MKDEQFELMWKKFLENVHQNAGLKKDAEVTNLIGGVKKFKELMKKAYDESKI